MSQSDRNNPKRGSATQSRYTFVEFDRDFPDDAACMRWLVAQLYPEGIFCPTCDKVTSHYRVKARTAYACQFCGHQEYPLAGTIFEGSATSLRLWFHAFYLMSQTRCGISAKQIEREVGVTYKTAWRMCNKIRSLLCEDVTDQGGEVEIDETYFTGSKRLGDNRKPGVTKNKRTVIGSVERAGRVVAKHVPNAKKPTVDSHITRHVLASSMVYTDELLSYQGLGKMGYFHHRINHSASVYVDGDVHTQTIEGFWSLVKRGISGAYHSVSAKYLQNYLDEYSFRYNHRRDEAGMFSVFLAQVAKATS